MRHLAAGLPATPGTSVAGRHAVWCRRFSSQSVRSTIGALTKKHGGRMDTTRRTLLTTGAAVAAAAAASGTFAQQRGTGDATATFYEKGRVRIRYQEAGTGFPLLVIPGGGLNSTMASLSGSHPFDPIAEFRSEYRCVTADLRNANAGQSTGPLEIDRPWDSYTDDHLGVMDHLGIDKFAVLGFCIGGPFIWNLLRRAPDRVVAAVCAQPSGFRKEQPDLFYQNNITGWGPALTQRRPEITMETVERFLTRMYRTNADFVFTVTRDFVRSCQTPVLVLPDDIPAHPFDVAMETVMLAPKSEVSIYPWKQPPERIPIAVRQIRSFLRAHRPA
jgi:pimeloyl-ACP methyl ester carboxylesterase